MAPYVIMVDFQIKPGAKIEFRRLVDANARNSCSHEPGCRRFDVLEVPDQPDRILLYDSASASLVARKQVIACDLVCEGSSGLKMR
jgi:hypothetical protein